jgi:hypothetical protein
VGKHTIRKLTSAEIQRRTKAVHGDTVILVESTYKGTHVKAKFIDKDLGEWWAIPKNVYGLGNGHPGKRAAKISKSKTMTSEEIVDRLFKKHGTLITLDETTYTNVSTACRFIDKEYGEWWTIPINVIYEGCRHPDGTKNRRKKTIQERFGVDYATQNTDIALKAIRKSKLTHIKFHWKTNEELVCQASWEAKIVDYLNKNKIDFLWQHKTFTLPTLTLKGNASSYRPDLFLINENKWVEIKGWMRPQSQIKWDWFHAEYPNSELWDRAKLRSMGIMVK